MRILSMGMLVMVCSLLEVLLVDGEQRDDHPIPGGEDEALAAVSKQLA